MIIAFNIFATITIVGAILSILLLVALVVNNLKWHAVIPSLFIPAIGFVGMILTSVIQLLSQIPWKSYI